MGTEVQYNTILLLHCIDFDMVQIGMLRTL